MVIYDKDEVEALPKEDYVVVVVVIPEDDEVKVFSDCDEDPFDFDTIDIVIPAEMPPIKHC